jgi:hypothetical protein
MTWCTSCINNTYCNLWWVNKDKRLQMLLLNTSAREFVSLSKWFQGPQSCHPKYRMYAKWRWSKFQHVSSTVLQGTFKGYVDKSDCKSCLIRLICLDRNSPFSIVLHIIHHFTVNEKSHVGWNTQSKNCNSMWNENEK